MSESVEELLQEMIEGQLLAFQILLLELSKNQAIDMDHYLGSLLDYSSQHVDSDSGTAVVIGRIFQ